MQEVPVLQTFSELEGIFTRSWRPLGAARNLAKTHFCSTFHSNGRSKMAKVELRGNMRRREFIGGLGVAAAWPLAARTQQPPAMPVVGWLDGRSLAAIAPYMPAFRQALSARGYVEGRNLTLEYRYADGQQDRLPALAADLLRRRIAVIVTAGIGTRAIRAINPTIPIVFYMGADPVRLGIVPNLNRPGGNDTGIFVADLESKRLGILHRLLPHVTTIAVLVYPGAIASKTIETEVQDAARLLGLQINILHASTDRELDAVFSSLSEMRAGALLVTINAFFSARVEQIAGSAARTAMPTMYVRRDFPAAGGLISYGSSDPDIYRVIGDYTGRILNGAKAGDLPVQRPTKFELIINLKTSKTLGLEIPSTLLALADEVIE
jgi:putative tryptophan/tyrosine transport system substrate-binding protein